MKRLAFEVLYFDVDTFEELHELRMEMEKKGYEMKNRRILRSSMNERYIRVKFSKGDFVKYEHEFKENPKSLFQEYK
ncbi:MAG: hypothetical protein ABS939_17155 [Psychrobacillus sp.]